MSILKCWLKLQCLLFPLKMRELHKECLFDTNFSTDWITDKICQSVGEFSTLDYWRAEKVGIGQGFMSSIIRLELGWTDRDTELPNSVILKIPAFSTWFFHLDSINMEDEERLEAERNLINVLLPKAHGNECVAYQLLSTADGLPVPRCFYSQQLTRYQSGILILEDFWDIATTVNIVDGLNGPQLERIAESLASMHAFSLKNPGWQDNFESMEQDNEKTWPSMATAALEKLRDMKPEYFEELMPEIQWCFDLVCKYQHEDPHKDCNLPSVMAHGDFWTNNMLFGFNPDQSISNRLFAIIDWQTVHPSGCAHDLARVLVSSCSVETRRQHTNRILRIYYENLCYKMDGKCPLSLKDVYKCFSLTLPLRMVYFLCAVPFLAESQLVEGEEKTKKVLELLTRAKAIIEDVIPLKCRFVKLGLVE